MRLAESEAFVCSGKPIGLLGKRASAAVARSLALATSAAGVIAKAARDRGASASGRRALRHSAFKHGVDQT
jgi:hypothetical protein